MAEAISKSLKKVWIASVVSPTVYLVAQSKFPDALPAVWLPFLFLGFFGSYLGLWLVWSMWIYPKLFSPLNHLPQPKENPWPIIGQMRAIGERPAGARFLRWMEEVPNDGMIRFPGVFNQDLLLLTNPRTLGEVLVQKAYDFEKPSGVRDLLRIILGNGLIVTEGDAHKFQRKHILPSFRLRHIKELYPIFWSKASELKERIAADLMQKSTGDQVVEINGWANKVTIDVIGLATMGRNFNTLHHSGDELIKDYEEILEPTMEKTLYFLVHIIIPRWFIAMWPWKLNKRLRETTSSLRNVCIQLVKDKKALLKQDSENQVDILSLLIKSNDFSDEMLVDQLLTFLAAGHETTSSAFTWATHLLATHPDIQARLREEIRGALPSPSSSIQEVPPDLHQTLEDLPLLNAVCNETLRLYPTVPVTVRIASRDTTVMENFIPQNTLFLLSPWATNRNSKLWGPDAMQFVPERWIDKETGKANNTGGVSSNYCQLTFLHGPRSCIGEKFARAELKALIAVFVGAFSMETVRQTGNPIPAGAITSKPNDGMHLKLKVVDGW